MTVKELRDFIFENYYQQRHLLKKTIIIQCNISKKDLQLFAAKLIEKIPYTISAKKYYQSFLGKKTQSW